MARRRGGATVISVVALVLLTVGIARAPSFARSNQTYEMEPIEEYTASLGNRFTCEFTGWTHEKYDSVTCVHFSYSNELRNVHRRFTQCVAADTVPESLVGTTGPAYCFSHDPQSLPMVAFRVSKDEAFKVSACRARYGWRIECTLVALVVYVMTALVGALLTENERLELRAVRAISTWRPRFLRRRPAPPAEKAAPPVYQV
jgi:hypothetical protein